MNRIRRMNKEDLQRVVEMEKETFSQPWTQEGFWNAMQLPKNCFLVIEDEEGVQGYCGYYQVLDEAEVMNVCVKKEKRGRGLGKAMMKQLLAYAKKGGAASIVLEARVSNEAAIHVYETLGFVALGVRKGFYEQPTEDALIMQCIF
ncbi:ribosomal-protein-alanine N-acetyltransferase [Lachnospiraceae bacterium XBB1006]|nr:ribosomal-protein-alanine N-acetyltransferase [Lachnospiraceae bacterium XBB1006]